MQPQNAYPSPPSSGGSQPPRKRPYSTAFTKSAATGPRPHAAPAVPSFNAGIPLSLPPETTNHSTAKTKKPRKHNQLGLTPASQDHESSSDDENEEAKLASKILSNASLVQFEYKGRTAILRTAAEIAAWIADRKKNYPTKVRADAAKKEAAEKKRKWAEVRKQREEAAQAKGLERKKAQREELRLKALESKKSKDLENFKKKAEGARDDEIEEDENNAIKAKKARIKADKLRLRAEKAELKVLKAEAEARKAKKRRASQQSSTPVQDESKVLEVDADSAIALEDNDGENVGEADGAESEAIHNIHQNIKDAAKKKAKIFSTINGEDDGSRLISDSSPRSSLSLLSISDSSALSDAESTSSSATLSSSSDSYSDSDSESAPEQATSKRLQPTRVPPPPRRSPLHTQHLCRSLLATGHCRRGDECQYSHDLPETLPSLGERKQNLKEKRRIRLGKVKAVEGPAKKERRKGLWQVMVEKEQEEERKQVLRAIVFMGEKGMLEEDEKKAGRSEGAA
jgi:Nuclear fragile X mental retardation-interacting protein 1 (NUFIP1)/Zinc finger C-x8-C-x5-C-x3-H type (and similar)